MLKITVVTADIIDSRKKAFTENGLRKVLSGLQHPDLLSPFTISRGDEVQGVLSGWLKAPEVIRWLRYSCRPMLLRIGIGIGTVPDKSIKKNSWSMNGQPFYFARAALDDAKKQKGPSTVIKTGMVEFDEIVNCIWLLTTTIQRGWSDKQWDAVQAYESRLTYDEAAKHLGITLQNVQKRCRAANWNQLRHAESTIKSLQSYLEKYHLLDDIGDFSQLEV